MLFWHKMLVTLTIDLTSSGSHAILLILPIPCIGLLTSLL